MILSETARAPVRVPLVTEPLGILGSLRAPALVPLYDVDVSADPPYMIFGPIPELSLEQHIEHHGPLPLELARAVLDALAETLAATHRVGFVHRDLHPGHVFLELPEDGPPVVKLLGFGRVRAIGDAATFSECDDVSMIPVYAAPELFVEDESDPRTDVYGLACIAYRALTGERPIDLRGASSVAAAIMTLMRAKPRPPSELRPELPPAVDSVLGAALAKTPGERFDSVEAFRRALDAALSGAGKPSSLPPRPVVPAVGEILDGSYRIVGRLGSGGMGTVLLAKDVRLQRLVAIKLLHALSAERQERFLGEARAMARVSHPNVVGVHDFGVHQGTPFVVMEHVPGRTVQELLDASARRGGSARLPLEDALAILDQAAAGIAAVHQAGLVHGDVKPSNILVGPAFRVCVADFGLVHAADQWVRGTERVPSGTPAYCAPERVEHCVRPDLASRVDVYALGVTAFELLTGRLPFDDPDPNPWRTFELHVKAPVPKASEVAPELGGCFDPVLAAALAKDPAERTASAERLRLELSRAARTCLRRRETPPRVLVADADQGHRELLSLEIEELQPDAEIEVVDGAAALLEALERAPVDAVVLDLELAGLSTLAAIRARSATPPPILGFAADPGASDHAELSALGVRAVLEKPADRNLLALNLKRVLRR